MGGPAWGTLTHHGRHGFFRLLASGNSALANTYHRLRLNIVVLTRDPAAFARKAPHLTSDPALTLWAGDVRDFPFLAGEFTHVVHAAMDSDRAKIMAQPLSVLDTLVQGTRRVLDFAVQAGARRVLLMSSGAVYGRQPPQLTHVGEDYSGAPDVLSAAASYGEGKRVSEMLGGMYARQHSLDIVLVRPFAFLGPYQPIGGDYAVGSFLRNGLEGQLVQVAGDGTPRRSYLYASDLAVWLWTLLLRGDSLRPYNVGSEEDVSIQDVARKVSLLCGGLGMEITKTPDLSRPAERYVPSTQRARVQFGLRQTVSLDEALKKTIRWHQNAPVLG